MRRTRIDGTVEYRLSARLVPDEATGCILWTGTLNHDGYGVMMIGGTPRKVHRVVWELARGPIPDGLELDHVRAVGCVNRHCANIEHLELVTHAENKRRALKESCVHGHPYDETNTGVIKRTRARYCRACKRERGRLDRERARLGAAS